MWRSLPPRGRHESYRAFGRLRRSPLMPRVAARGPVGLDSGARHHHRRCGARWRHHRGRGYGAPRRHRRQRRLRGARRAAGAAHGPRPVDRLHRVGGAGQCRSGRYRHAGLLPGPRPRPARPDQRRARLPRPAYRGRRAGGARGRLPGRGASPTGKHRDQPDPPVPFPFGELPAPERHRCQRRGPAVHAARSEPGPHSRHDQRVAAASDRPDEQLRLRHGRGVERGGPQCHSRRGDRPNRGATRRRVCAVRLGRHRGRGEPGAQGGRVHAVPERRGGPLRDEDLPRRRQLGRRERRGRPRLRPRIARALRRVPAPRADQPRLRRPVRGEHHRRG